MLNELGLFKEQLYTILTHDERIRRLLLGEDYSTAVPDASSELAKYIRQHPYREPSTAENGSYLFIETHMPSAGPGTKTISVVIQAVCHSGSLSYPEKPPGCSGLRYDVLAQYVEELLCPTDRETVRSRIREFGIGRMELVSAVSFGDDKNGTYMGRTLTFSVPCFR